MPRAATTLADPCTGAQRRDFLLGLHRGIVANSSGHKSPHGAQGTGWVLVAPNELARLASLQLMATRRLRRVQGWTRYGRSFTRQRPHDAANSSRAPSVARGNPRPRRPLWTEPEDRHQVAQAHH